jgi:hypothetical protein
MYSWTPKWVRIKIDMGGRVIETCKDESTGLIICPLCVNIDKLCPKDRDGMRIIPEKPMYFFSEEDLRHHIYAHSQSSEWGKISISEREEETEEEEEEEDEER